MTNDPGVEIRERFRAAPLPPAPVRLREHLAAFALAPSATARPRYGSARLVLSFVAVLAIASIGLVAGGALDDPGPSPSPLTAEATAEATAEPYPFQVVCEEAEAPALTCTEMLEMVLDILPTNSRSIATIEVTRRCDTPCLPEATIVWFVITSDSGQLVDGGIWPNGSWQMMSSQTDAPTECPELEPPAPTCRNYSDD